MPSASRDINFTPEEVRSHLPPAKQIPFAKTQRHPIVALNGESWQENRKYSFRVLKSLGFEKQAMEEHVREEVRQLTQLLSATNGKPMRVAKALSASAANNVLSLVVGKRYDLDDPFSRFVEGLLTKFLRQAAIFSHYDFFPIVRFFAAFIPNTRMHAMNQVFSEVSKLVRKELKQRKGDEEPYAEKDFIGGYLKKVLNSSVDGSHYSMRHLEGNALNFLAAATNTVRTSVLWNLCIAASDPDGHQARAQREIDAALGRHRAPAWDDRHQLPYTMATVLETLRWRTIAPLGINRSREKLRQLDTGGAKSEGTAELG
ncbi:hypothetical protein HPB50_025834 [Hyalomma asiaticum]|uniref:Uncharacterized protein n=1 Tax=Hyalomma asiaticum TaxID=266040 RepID=A0ACB7STQ4_HYAAI|nr:hypothetical protein HPB50_025834 [Hyalomma asiaticum]